MSFGQRLFRYVLGFAIGCVAVYLMFPNHDWLGWTPGKQVLRSIRESEISISGRVSCQLNCFGLQHEMLDMARAEGSINFKESDTHSNPKRYHLQYKQCAFQVLMTSDTTATFDDLRVVGSDQNCLCNED